MAATSDGLSAAALLALAAAQPAQGINDEQVRNAAILVARQGLTSAQALAIVAPRAPAAVVNGHAGRIAQLAATKTAANPQWTELVR